MLGEDGEAAQLQEARIFKLFYLTSFLIAIRLAIGFEMLGSILDLDVRVVRDPGCKNTACSPADGVQTRRVTIKNLFVSR